MVQFIDIDDEAQYAARVRERAKDPEELEKIKAAPSVKSTDLTTEQKREVEPIFDDSDDDDDDYDPWVTGSSGESINVQTLEIKQPEPTFDFADTEEDSDYAVAEAWADEHQRQKDEELLKQARELSDAIGTKDDPDVIKGPHRFTDSVSKDPDNTGQALADLTRQLENFRDAHIVHLPEDPEIMAQRQNEFAIWFEQHQEEVARQREADRKWDLRRREEQKKLEAAQASLRGDEKFWPFLTTTDAYGEQAPSGLHATHASIDRNRLQQFIQTGRQGSRLQDRDRGFTGDFALVQKHTNSTGQVNPYSLISEFDKDKFGYKDFVSFAVENTSMSREDATKLAKLKIKAETELESTSGTPKEPSKWDRFFAGAAGALGGSSISQEIIFGQAPIMPTELGIPITDLKKTKAYLEEHGREAAELGLEIVPFLGTYMLVKRVGKDGSFSIPDLAFIGASLGIDLLTVSGRTAAGRMGIQVRGLARTTGIAGDMKRTEVVVGNLAQIAKTTVQAGVGVPIWAAGLVIKPVVSTIKVARHPVSSIKQAKAKTIQYSQALDTQAKLADDFQPIVKEIGKFDYTPQVFRADVPGRLGSEGSRLLMATGSTMYLDPAVKAGKGLVNIVKEVVQTPVSTVLKEAGRDIYYTARHPLRSVSDTVGVFTGSRTINARVIKQFDDAIERKNNRALKLIYTGVVGRGVSEIPEKSIRWMEVPNTEGLNRNELITQGAVPGKGKEKDYVPETIEVMVYTEPKGTSIASMKSDITTRVNLDLSFNSKGELVADIRADSVPGLDIEPLPLPADPPIVTDGPSGGKAKPIEDILPEQLRQPRDSGVIFPETYRGQSKSPLTSRPETQLEPEVSRVPGSKVVVEERPAELVQFAIPLKTPIGPKLGEVVTPEIVNPKPLLKPSTKTRRIGGRTTVSEPGPGSRQFIDARAGTNPIPFIDIGGSDAKPDIILDPTKIPQFNPDFGSEGIHQKAPGKGTEIDERVTTQDETDLGKDTEEDEDTVKKPGEEPDTDLDTDLDPDEPNPDEPDLEPEIIPDDPGEEPDPPPGEDPEPVPVEVPPYIPPPNIPDIPPPPGKLKVPKNGDTPPPKPKASRVEEKGKKKGSYVVLQVGSTPKDAGKGAPVFKRVKINKVIRLKSYPARGWKFSRWEGDIEPQKAEQANVTIVMDEDRDIVAVFEPDYREKVVYTHRFFGKPV